MISKTRWTALDIVFPGEDGAAAGECQRVRRYQQGKGEAIAAVMARHFSTRDILTDDRVAREPLPADHQARNTWLRSFRVGSKKRIPANARTSNCRP